MRSTSWVLALALVATMTLLIVAPVAGAELLTLDPNSGARGATVKAIGSGFPANCAISILWDGVEVKSATSLSTTFQIEFRVPGDATYGPHTVTMAVTDSDPAGCAPSVSDKANFIVMVAVTPSPVPTPTPTPQALATEAPQAPLNPLPLAISAAVLFLGAAVLFLVRRRRIAVAARRAAEPGAWRRRHAEGGLSEGRR
jgi:hypothetical protein